jgi:hypothetical protein
VTRDRSLPTTPLVGLGRSPVRYSIGTALAFIVFFALTALGLQQVGRLVAIAGLLQRITIMIGLGWTSVLAVHITRKPPSP